MHDELVQQLQADRAWRPVVEQMSPGCIPVGAIFGEYPNARKHSDTMFTGAKHFGLLAAVQHGALILLENKANDWRDEDGSYGARDVTLPRHLDTSVGQLADDMATARLPAPTRQEGPPARTQHNEGSAP
jgi:hypothetical protein